MELSPDMVAVHDVFLAECLFNLFQDIEKDAFDLLEFFNLGGQKVEAAND